MRLALFIFLLLILVKSNSQDSSEKLMHRNKDSDYTLYADTKHIPIDSLPDLAQRTLRCKLLQSDFAIQQKYMVNVDTLRFAKETLSGEFTFYDTKSEMIEKINHFMIVLSNKKIEYFKTLRDNLFFQPRKYHWFMLIDNYRLDWWFSAVDHEKLETITLVKRNN